MSNSIDEKLQQAFGCFNARDLAGTERLCGEILRGAPHNPDALHLLGVVRLVAGNAGEAASLISRALETKPQDAAMLENLGVAHLAARDHAVAETVFRKALKLGASHGLLYMRLGLALEQQGRLPEAEEALRTAVAKAPDDPDVHNNLGNALAGQGRHEEALACYRKVLALRPRHVDAHYNIGTLFKHLGRNDEAVSAYQSALALAPDYADCHNNLGTVYDQMGRLEEAIACYRKVFALDPNHVHAHNNLGNALQAQGRLNEAIECYERALSISPDFADALINLGNVRARQGLFGDAQARYEKVLVLDHRSVDAHRNLGALLKMQGRLEEAIIHYRMALALEPGRARICNDLGNACREHGDFDEAAACYRKAIAMDPQQAHAHYNLAETLKLHGRFDEAIAAYERALALKPDYFQALGGLAHLRQHVCDWQGIEVLWDRLRRDAFGKTNAGVSPFSLLSMPSSAEEHLACATAWASQHLAPLIASRAGLRFEFSARPASGKLRVGYLSWDFHRHATSYLIAELFELHDRARFEIFAYSCGPDDGSAIRARIKSASDCFVDVAHESFIAAAQRIYGDGVDILVDLKGYTQGARTQIIALRPAPIQVNWLGYPGTMGTDCIDYIIADPFIIPEGMERCYAEKVVRLPGCYQINDRRREVSERTPTREECGLPAQGFVFCCFNQTYKILPEMFALWMRVMQAVPESVLWLLETNQWVAGNLRRAAAAKGIAPERLVFAPRKPQAEHLARYRVVDLAIDTLPYASHTTASDALWMGCPLVTCVGETFASRVAGSILTSAGLTQLVTNSLGQYERLILELATHRDALRDFQRKLRENRDSCELFDTPRFVSNLERSYEEMFDAYTRAARIRT